MTNSRSATSATSSRPLRLLLAGLGAFGKEHLSRLTERSDVKVVGVADGNGLQYGSATQAADPTAAFVLPLLEKALAGQDIPKRSLMTEGRITKETLDKYLEYCSAA